MRCRAQRNAIGLTRARGTPLRAAIRRGAPSRLRWPLRQGIRVHNDSLFRAVFARIDNVRGWLQELLQDQHLCGQIDWSSFEKNGGKAVDGKLGQHEADLSFTSKLLRAVRLLLAVVECASGRRRRIAAQTIRYSMVLLEKFTDEHGLLHRPVVLPIVLHTGRKPLAEPMSLESADVPSRIGRDNGGLAFGIVLDDLAAQTEEHIRARKLPAAVKLAFLFAQGIDRRTPAEVEGALLRWQDLLRELASPPGHVEELEIFQSYVLKTTEMPVEHCMRVLANILDPLGVQIVQTTADKLRAEGRAEGLAKGESIGATNGRRALIEELLRRRFGSIPKRFQTRLNQAAIPELDAIGIRLLDAATIEAVFEI